MEPNIIPHGPEINVCENGHRFTGTNICPKCGNPVIDTYQRVVGFLTPDQSGDIKLIDAIKFTKVFMNAKNTGFWNRNIRRAEGGWYHLSIFNDTSIIVINLCMMLPTQETTPSLHEDDITTINNMITLISHHPFTSVNAIYQDRFLYDDDINKDSSILERIRYLVGQAIPTIMAEDADII